jgi:hypothetical protein
MAYDYIIASNGARLAPFKPGENSRTRHTDQVRAETAQLLAQFRQVHGRDPLHSESLLVNSAALLAVRLRRPKATERMMNSHVRLLRRLGLLPSPRKFKVAAGSSAARKSGRAMLEGSAK